MFLGGGGDCMGSGPSLAAIHPMDGPAERMSVEMERVSGRKRRAELMEREEEEGGEEDCVLKGMPAMVQARMDGPHEYTYHALDLAALEPGADALHSVLGEYLLLRAALACIPSAVDYMDTEWLMERHAADVKLCRGLGAATDPVDRVRCVLDAVARDSADMPAHAGAMQAVLEDWRAWAAAAADRTQSAEPSDVSGVFLRTRSGAMVYRPCTHADLRAPSARVLRAVLREHLALRVALFGSCITSRRFRWFLFDDKPPHLAGQMTAVLRAIGDKYLPRHQCAAPLHAAETPSVLKAWVKWASGHK